MPPKTPPDAIIIRKKSSYLLGMRIFDLHSDILSEKGQKKAKKILEKYPENSLKSLITAIYSTGKSEKEIFNMAKTHLEERNYFEERGSAFELILSYEDLGFITPTNIHSVLLTNPKMCSLTWNYDNLLAGGSHGQNGLTDYGQKVVEILESEGVFIDTAHLNERSFMDVARVAKRPLVCSHTAFSAVNNHPRNLKDYQIRIILESGGLVGLCAVSYFLSPAKRVTCDDLITHILHFANTFGSLDGLAIGTDFFGTKHLPKNLKDYADFAYIENSLISLGFTEEDIDKLFYTNSAKLLL